jgi:hypothetical protein
VYLKIFKWASLIGCLLLCMMPIVNYIYAEMPRKGYLGIFAIVLIFTAISQWPVYIRLGKAIIYFAAVLNFILLAVSEAAFAKSHNGAMPPDYAQVLFMLPTISNLILLYLVWLQRRAELRSD